MTSSPTRPQDLRGEDDTTAATHFPLDDRLLHLNHGSYGAVPLIALEEQRRLRGEMEARPLSWFRGLPERLADARRSLVPFLRIAEEEFAFVTNASAGASAVYASQPHHDGGEILVTDHGYGAVVMGAERLARRWNGRVRVVHIPLDAEEEESTARVVESFGARTRLIVIDQITSPTARRLPVEAISLAAAERGIAVLIDGAHAPGLMADPRRSGNNAYWIGNLHKFACAPRGAAVLAAPPHANEHLFPPIDSWGAAHPFPQRFDYQGTVDMTAALVAPVSVGVIEQQWGWQTVREHAGAIAAYGQALLADALSALTGEDHYPAVGMPIDAIRLVRLPRGLVETPEEAHRLQSLLLTEYSVETAPTSFDGGGFLRISGHAYSTAAEIEEAVERILDAVRTAARAPQAR